MTDTAEPMTSSATVTANGQPRSLDGVGAHTTALQWLRDSGLTGSKEGCAEGECGACAVMVSRPDGQGGTRWTALNSCLIPAAALADQEVYTAEGFAGETELHPVQHEMAMRGGSQCGYCTPGFISSMAAEYYREERASCCEGDCCSPSEEQVVATAQMRPSGNHLPWKFEMDDDAVPRTSISSSDTLQAQQAADRAAGCCADDRDPDVGANGFDLHALSGNLCRCTGYRPIRDAAFALGQVPADDPIGQRRNQPAPTSSPLRLDHPEGTFIRPAGLDEALQLLQQEPNAVLLAGATDWGVELTIRHRRAPLTIALDQMQELREFDTRSDYVEIGAALTLSEIEARLNGSIPMLSQVFPQFASKLIRNGATLGGNLGTGSPIGDTPPALLALDAQLVLTSLRGDRTVPLAEYFTGYRQSVREPDELIRAIRIPTPVAPLGRFYKVAKRRFDDISSVALGIAATVNDGIIERIRIGIGGAAATPIRAWEVESALQGQSWSAEAFASAAGLMREVGTPMSDHRASSAYRSAMLEQAIHRFHAEVTP